MGLRYDNVSDMPLGMQRQIARKMAVRVKSVTCANQGTIHDSKYHNEPTVVEGIKFDSKKEARRFLDLKEALLAGAIVDLKLQQNFTLQEGFTSPNGERHRAIIYKADFTYKVNGVPLVGLLIRPDDEEFWSEVVDTCGPGTVVIEDVKSAGTRTDKYRIKKKLMAEKGYHIREV